MRIRLASAAAIALLTAACSSEPAPLSGIVREADINVGSLTLPDVTEAELRAGGRVEEGEIRFSAEEGRLLLVYFGFTHCPDVCPATLADLRVALRDVDRSDRVDLVFVTVDPDRDTPEVLNEYMQFFSERFHTVSTTEERLRPVADAFLVRYEVDKDEDGQVLEVAHSAVLYAVDSEGRVVVEWPFGTRAPQLAADLNQLLEDA